MQPISGMSIPIGISLITVAWSAGLFVGLFTAKFVSKKECRVEKNKLHERIDNIQNLLSGGRIYFELRQVQETE